MEPSCPIPQASGKLPLFGHILLFLYDPLGFLNSLPACGDLVQVRIGPLTALVVCDPHLTHEVLTHDRTFDKGGALFERLREVFGNDIVSCPHSEHRRRRRVLQPAFHSTRLPGYAHIMTEQTTIVIGSWRDGQVIDVLDEMQAVTARIAAMALFGNALTEVGITEVLDDLTIIMAGVYQRMLTPALLDTLPTGANRRYTRARARLHQTAAEIIDSYRSSGVRHDDLLSMLLGREDDRQPCDAEITGQVISFFLGSTETTASTLSWALYLLSRHPDVEERLHREVDAALFGAPATFADLPKLQLTNRIITETLRLYPPGWLLTRTTTTDTQLSGHPITAGTAVVYSPYIIHHRPDVYPKPDRFDPDRWDSEHITRPPRGGMVAFGSGARRCLGDTFAVTQATLCLATVAARWRLTSTTRTRPVRPRLGIVLNPRKLRMRTISRTLTSTVVPPGSARGASETTSNEDLEAQGGWS